MGIAKRTVRSLEDESHSEKFRVQASILDELHFNWCGSVVSIVSEREAILTYDLR